MKESCEYEGGDKPHLKKKDDDEGVASKPAMKKGGKSDGGSSEKLGHLVHHKRRLPGMK